jgi:Big-like domain-containing protein
MPVTSTDGGFAPPEVVDISIEAEEVSPTASIDLVFSEALDASSVVADTVVIVAGEIDQGFRSDLDNPPLGDTRAARVLPVHLSIAGDGERVHVAPAAPLQPKTAYTLAVSRAVRDRDGIGMEQAYAFRFTTTDGEGGAPVLEMVEPAPGAPSVPTNLARVLVRFGEPVTGVDGTTLRLMASGTVVAAVVRSAERWCAGCYEIVPSAELAAGALHSVVADAAIRDADGNAPFAGEDPSFTTGAGPDETSPVLWLPEARVSGGCLLARWLSDEPATSEVLETFLGDLVEVHQVGAALSTPGTVEFAVESADAADNRSSLGPLLATYAPGPKLVVTEVLANPVGAEPAQEWVEVANLDDAAVPLLDLSFADEGGEDELPDVTLPPGAVALIVSQSYDPLEGSDPPPGPEAILVRVTGSLGQSGLRNSGERVEIRDAAGTVLSSYGGYLDVASEPGRSAVRTDLAGCDVPASWALSEAGASTPGAL